MKEGSTSKNPKPKTSGTATPLGFNANDTPWLIGGIVEKGFSAPTSAPRPTVLPFPVARHRSHGPHWAPKVDARDDEDEFVEKGEFDGMEKVAHVAKPLARKEKKGLDFSRWKEMMKNNGIGEKKMGAHLAGAESGKSTDMNIVDNLSSRMDIDVMKEESMTVDDKDMIAFGDTEAGDVSCDGIAISKDSVMDEITPEWENGSSKQTETSSQMQRLPITDGGVGGDLQSQIDAENRARLSKMSTEEIAEAQTEIMQKFNPKLIDALKRRGLAKVTKQKFSLSDDTEAHSSQRQENLSKLAATSDSSLSHKPVKVVGQEAQKFEGNKHLPSMTEQRSHMWDAWRNRVERVRDIRFSLEGTIVNSDTTSVSGSVSSQSGYTADNVSERDMLRTEGDPGAAGYTIKEAVALTRSLIPSQRCLALKLIAAVLDKALTNICQNQVHSSPKSIQYEGSVDWEAIWAFALGPEPELVFSLRLCLDDNHNSVVLACAKAIQCALSCEMNEIIFNIIEKTPTFLKDVCSSPVFRSRPDINMGFLRGGFWKYNTKPSNISPQFGEESMADKSEEERTIQDDISITGQDVAAGLVRMGILPRICYLLETDGTASLEECLISILIAVARHSPTCAAEVVNCERLLQTVADRFALKEQMDINPCKIKSITLFKVLARFDKNRCFKFIHNGFIRKMTWHLYRHPQPLDKWLNSGKEVCKLSSALLVEQLRLWKVCIQYGHGLSHFPDLFTSVCIWLSVPSFEKLIENDVVNEYCAITKEAYLLFDVLARKLPNCSYMRGRREDAAQEEEGWSWNHFDPIIDLALGWIEVKSNPYLSEFYCAKDNGKSSLPNSQLNSLLWVISSVFSMLCSSLKAVIPEDTAILQNQPLERLPEFVVKIGLKIVKNGYFGFSGLGDKDHENCLSENDSIAEHLCHLRLRNEQELAISSTCCLQGLVQLAACVDKLVRHANLDIHKDLSKFTSLSREDKILANGILKTSVVEVHSLLTTLMKLITNEWLWIQPVEKFGRGGPAPGVGVGWGATGGGYWSIKTLLAQEDARLLTCLIDVSEISAAEVPLKNGETGRTFEMLNCALASCLVAGPATRLIIDQLLNFISQVSVLKYLDTGIRQFLRLRKGIKPFKWDYKNEEYLLFADVLASHFRNRWLVIKKKKDKSDKQHISNQTSKSLETIHEEPKTTAEGPTSLVQEWAHQRLHLPTHWFLSALSTIPSEKDMLLPSDFLEVSKAGLFFLLGLEAMPMFLNSETHCVVHCVPIIWKLHALSVTLLSGMGVLEDDKSRDVFEALQNVYGESLDEKKVGNLLLFESDIHENYSTFIENLVDQFSADSYGDLVFGRQVAMYLHRSVEASVRFATWKALSNAHVLELLPPPDKCLRKVVGYLEPVETDERILEAYAKSWVSGGLDKAVVRGSVASLVALHHLSSFIFSTTAGDMVPLRNKLVKLLLRDCSQKKQHEGMMVKLICYKKLDMTVQPESDAGSVLPAGEIDKRLKMLKEISEGNSSLVTALEKLESAVRRDSP